MTRERVSFKHRPLIEQKLQVLRSPLCQYSFIHFYLNRFHYDYTFVHEELCYLVGTRRQGQRIIIPLDPVESSLPQYQKAMEYENASLYPLPVEQTSLFDPTQFTITHKKRWDDYYYQTEKIATYSGRHLDGRRNLVHHFEQSTPHTVQLFDHSLATKAFELLDVWKKNTQIEADTHLMQEGIEKFEALNLYGVCLLTDDKMIGLALGGPLYNDAFAIHFAKADIHYPGVYQALYQQLAITLLKKFHWLNFEEDLGIESIRLAKTEYHPDHMETKIMVGLKI